MRFCLLGPVQICDQERGHTAGTWKEQCVLAILLLERGRPVSAQTLAERLWDEQLPNKARETLQAHVSRLRRRLRTLGAHVDPIKGSRAGYQMNVPAEAVDALRFDQLVSQASATAPTEAHTARDLLRQAEDLWNGEPLAGLDGSWAEATRHMLLDKRRAALLRRFALDLQLGDRKDDVVAELTALASDGRTDQRVTALLMRALDAAGRLEDALALYDQTRIRVREDSGADLRPELRVLHVQLLNGTAGSPRPTTSNRERRPGAIAPVHALDLNPPYLAGRDDELSTLIGEVTADLRTGVSVVAVDGMAGVGKTAFATRAAHLLSTHCPDGALQIKLRTHDHHQPPLDPQAALTQLLDMIATPMSELGRADTLDALATVWRRRTSGRKLLVVLDDVRDAAQIEPLIPTSPGTIVLITSRRRLSGLPNVRQHTLSLLPDAAVLALLNHITERDFRSDHEYAPRFIRRCGGLPLAVTLAAGHLRARPMWTLGDLVDRLSITSRTLADDPLTGPIHTAFALSYRALQPELQTLLHHLAVHPGHDVSLSAAAALAGAGSDADTEVQAATSLTDTAVQLDTLIDYRLIEHTGPHRYRLHDLLREYLISSRTDEQIALDNAALDRVYAFYQAAAARADHAVYPHRRALNYPAPSTPLEGLELETAEQARGWLDNEHHNLAAVIAHAHQHGQLHRIGLLPHVLVQHLDRRGYWHSALDTINSILRPDALRTDPAKALTKGSAVFATTGPANADAANNTNVTAVATTDAGITTTIAAPNATTARLLTDQAALFIRVEELDKALRSADAAVAAWAAIGDDYGQADAHIQRGRIFSATGPADQAVQAYRAAAELYEKLGDSSRLAVAEYQWGIIAFIQGRYDEAFSRANHALDLARESHDAAVQCDVLTNLGEMHHRYGRDDLALVHLQEAQNLAERLGDPLNTAVLGNNIGTLHDSAGDHQQALASFHMALRIFQTLGDHGNQVDSLVNLAGTHTRLGENDTALAELAHATALAEQADDRQRQSQIHLATGNVYSAQKDHPRALISYRAALAQAQPGFPLEQARAHRAIGDALAMLDDQEAARDHWQRADALHGPLE